MNITEFIMTLAIMENEYDVGLENLIHGFQIGYWDQTRPASMKPIENLSVLDFVCVRFWPAFLCMLYFFSF